MESERGLLSKPVRKIIKKPVQTKDRNKRIAEAERQLEILENLDQIFEPNLAVEEESRQEENLFTEGQSSQTNRNLSTMRESKQMVVPGTRDAPKFSSAKPRELRRFLRQMEDLWEEAGIEKDEEKKGSLGKYADQESEEEWRALDTYAEGCTWEAFKKEVLENYPEASAAERGTPARIRQIVKDAEGIEMGETTKLYTYRRAFLAEASKLKKPPTVMSNRELVELFMGGLSWGLGQAVLQYLGGSRKSSKKGKETVGDESERRPEDRYDLEEVCRAAGEVSENAQGMLSYKWASDQGPKRGSALVQTSTHATSGSTAMATKVEGLEQIQALEKDRLDAVSKEWGVRFEGLETMIKSLLTQSQEKPVASFVQGIGQGSGNFPHPEPMANRGFKSLSNNSGYNCFGCGEQGHFQNDCEKIRNLFRTGAITYNRDGRVCLPDGSRVPSGPPGASLADRVEKYYGTVRPTQAYYGTFEEMEEKMAVILPKENSYMSREVNDREQRLAKLEKECELKERENALLAKQLKLEVKAPEKPDVRAYFLDSFGEELKALQENKPGFL